MYIYIYISMDPFCVSTFTIGCSTNTWSLACTRQLVLMTSWVSWRWGEKEKGRKKLVGQKVFCMTIRCRNWKRRYTCHLIRTPSNMYCLLFTHAFFGGANWLHPKSYQFGAFWRSSQSEGLYKGKVPPIWCIVVQGCTWYMIEENDLHSCIYLATAFGSNGFSQNWYCMLYLLYL